MKRRRRGRRKSTGWPVDLQRKSNKQVQVSTGVEQHCKSLQNSRFREMGPRSHSGYWVSVRVSSTSASRSRVPPNLNRFIDSTLMQPHNRQNWGGLAWPNMRPIQLSANYSQNRFYSNFSEGRNVPSVLGRVSNKILEWPKIFHSSFVGNPY